MLGFRGISMSNINDLRRLAQQRHKAATRKISRIKAANGVEVSGSDYDPRKSPEFIRNATPTQLRALIRKLDAFNQRSVQFVPDAEMRPMSRKLWEQFEGAQDKRRQARDKSYDEFKNIPIGPLDSKDKAGNVIGHTTVDERLRQITPLHAHMAQIDYDNPYRRQDLKSTSVASEKKLKELISTRRKQSTAKHQAQVLKAHRDAVMDMLTITGDLDLMEDFGSLTNKQFALLWKYTVVPTHVKITYNFYKDEQTGRKGVTNSAMAANEMAQVREYIKWAKTVKFKK